MRYPASEKLEIIRLVEESALPVRWTLEKIGIPRATFYRWYDLYRGWWAGSPGRPTPKAGSRLEPHSRRCSRAHHQTGAGRARIVAEGIGRALHRRLRSGAQTIPPLLPVSAIEVGADDEDRR